MKNKFLSLLLALALLLCAFSACDSADTPPDAADAPPSADGETEADPYAGFEMPEATDTLTVYTTGMLGLVMRPAVERFRELYPDVTVDLETLADEEFDTRIETEIPAGKGPDVLFAYSLPDIYKTIETGIFEDLSPYMARDEEFRPEDYYDVLDAGLLNGIRGFLPVEIDLPILQTTEEALADAGIAREELRTWDGFLATAHRYKAEHPRSTVFSYGRDTGYLHDMVKNSGMPFIDYQNRVPAVDREKMEQLCAFCALDYREGAQPEWDNWFQQGGAVVERKALFCNFGGSVLTLTMDRYQHATESGENLIFETVPDIYDGVTANLISFAAIPKCSANKLNAWRLVKVLLSDEIQGGSNPPGYNYLRIGFPVRRESMEKRITDTVREYYGGGAPDYPDYEDEIARDIADISEVYGRMTGCSAVQSIVMKYISNAMTPCLKGNAPFDKCFDKLYGTLELYASE